MRILSRHLLIGSLFVFVLFCALKCDKNESDPQILGNWVEKSHFLGVSRGDAVAFSLGQYAYAGTGNAENVRLKDFFKYDTLTNQWTQIADFAGSARQGAVAFAAAGKGYVGTGWNGLKKFNDFWSYDPASNTWDSLEAEFEGDASIKARYAAVAFSIDDIGYMGTGFSGNPEMDLWAYDPAANTWTQKTNFQTKVYDAVAFVLNGKGYICTGYSNGEYSDDFYRYDPATNVWTAMRKISNVSSESYDDLYMIKRRKAVAFVINGKAYVTAGENPKYQNDVWEYTPETDLWKSVSVLEGAARVDAIAFSILDDRGYIATGFASSTYLDDTWEFKPLEIYDPED